MGGPPPAATTIERACVTSDPFRAPMFTREREEPTGTGPYGMTMSGGRTVTGSPALASDGGVAVPPVPVGLTVAPVHAPSSVIARAGQRVLDAVGLGRILTPLEPPGDAMFTRLP